MRVWVKKLTIWFSLFKIEKLQQSLPGLSVPPKYWLRECQLYYLKCHQSGHTDNNGDQLRRKKQDYMKKEVKPVESTNENPQSFLKIHSMLKKAALSHKLQDHAYD